MGKLRVYWLKALNKLSIYPLGNTPSVPSAWLAGTLEEHLGEGYWLSFNQRLPISYELGDCLYGLLHCSRLVQDEEDAEGEVAEDAIEEEII